MSWAGLWTAIGFLGFTMLVLLVLPVPKIYLARDFAGGLLVILAAWLLTRIAARLDRSFPRAEGIYQSTLGVLVGLGGGAILLVIVLDILISIFGLGGTIQVGLVIVPVMVALALAVPCSYLIAAALRLRDLERRYGPDGVMRIWAQQAGVGRG